MNPPSCIKDCVFVEQLKTDNAALKEMLYELRRQYNASLQADKSAGRFESPTKTVHSCENCGIKQFSVDCRGIYCVDENYLYWQPRKASAC